MIAPKTDELTKKLYESNLTIVDELRDPKNLNKRIIIIDSSRYLALQPVIDLYQGMQIVEIAKPESQGTVPSLRGGRDLAGLLSEYLTTNSQTPAYMILRDLTDKKNQVEIRIGDKDKVPLR